MGNNTSSIINDINDQITQSITDTTNNMSSDQHTKQEVSITCNKDVAKAQIKNHTECVQKTLTSVLPWVKNSKSDPNLLPKLENFVTSLCNNRLCMVNGVITQNQKGHLLSITSLSNQVTDTLTTTLTKYAKSQAQSSAGLGTSTKSEINTLVHQVNSSLMKTLNNLSSFQQSIQKVKITNAGTGTGIDPKLDSNNVLIIHQSNAISMVSKQVLNNKEIQNQVSSLADTLVASSKSTGVLKYILIAVVVVVVVGIIGFVIYKYVTRKQKKKSEGEDCSSAAECKSNACKEGKCGGSAKQEEGRGTRSESNTTTHHHYYHPSKPQTKPQTKPEMSDYERAVRNNQIKVLSPKQWW